ncbi:Ig-like domain-containing protein [Streptacidiphilus sp. PB12-B1b]|uniref:L,D-transpeptidase n=1 Tax=Streptacidiphilus sp. PB12-B1b TaxID=2705012 RepID=UPI00351A00ED
MIRTADTGHGRAPRRAVAGAAGLVALVLAGTAACSSSTSSSGGGHGSGGGDAAPATISVTLAKDSSGDVIPDQPVRIAVKGGTLASVTVADSKGDPVPGTLNAAGGTWTPSAPLAVGVAYTLSASAAPSGQGGKPTTDRVPFTVETPGSGSSMLLDSITPEKDAVVGVAMPVSVVFSKPVADSARAAVEKQLKVTTSIPVTGAWHWFSSTRADWRPQTYWKSGTKVTVDADLDGVSDGNGRIGVHDYQHSFTIGSDVEAVVDAAAHTMKVTQDGRLLRQLTVDTGAKGYQTWGGTMAVIDKQPQVEMTSCSVGIQCTPGGPNYYDLKLPWDVHLTFSGTYVHYSTGDTDPGDSTSHGCVHLSLADAKWFYGVVKQGDPVTVTGVPKNADPDNGYADFNLSWAQWTAGSTTPTS